ncbi:MAG TPA: dienelactone hydrolase family protein [Blastocatellia bacterium]|nr:dienelactone hydrolase family protein [Blastocatellia bacterium]
MTDEKKDQWLNDESVNDRSRRDFVAFSVAAGLGATTRSAPGAQLPVIETDVEVKTPDGICDAAFIHPAKGSYPGVLVWPDSGSLRPAFRELGKRIAAEGYAVLTPNHLYRTAKSPVFEESFDPVKNPADREKYARITAPFFAPGAVERDAAAYVAFLDAQQQVNKKKKMGTHGYCLGGMHVIKTAALFPDRVGAGVSFHGGLLATDKPDSPHLLAPKIKARLYFAIASDDDKREPDVKDKLKEAFAAAKVRAEIEVYPNALHGWCVPGGKAAENKTDADRAWSKLVALYKAAL